MIMKPSKLKFLVLLVVSVLFLSSPLSAGSKRSPTNFYDETGALIDIDDPVADDKGPGFYQYPLDQRIRRGTFDLRRFTVYEEGNILTFVIQMREYIMTEWPDTHRSDEQGFVANVFDIYVDTDRKPNSGYTKAFPGRDLEFADNMGWEKAIMITPFSQFRLYDILKNKTDDLEFQKMVDNIILPDYVQIQRDKLVVKINKEFFGKVTPNWGYQCFVLGFANIVSTGQLLNMGVRAFATPKDFGGGWDTYGDPAIMDCIVPEGQDQYDILKQYRSEPFRGQITFAKIPFVYPHKGEADLMRDSLFEPSISDALLTPNLPSVNSGKIAQSAVLMQTKPSKIDSPKIISADSKTSSVDSKAGEKFSTLELSSSPLSGFIPMKSAKTASGTNASDQGFKPLKKESTGFIPIRKAKPSQ